MDDNSISADIVDQASSYTDKNVEMKAINRQIKLISEIDKALFRIKDEETTVYHIMYRLGNRIRPAGCDVYVLHV